MQKRLATNSRRLVATALLLFVVIATGVGAHGGAGATSVPSPPRARSHGPFSALRPLSDSCAIVQSLNVRVSSVATVSLRDFPPSSITLSVPNGWACDIVDGDGSGASVNIFSPTSALGEGGGRNGIELAISANVQDGIDTGICPYSHFPRRVVYPACSSANSKRPDGVHVHYLLGSPASQVVIVMVSTPAHVPPPAFEPGPGGEPTVTVLALARSGFDLWMTCQIGRTLSNLCVHDAHAFASALRSSGDF